MKKRRKHKIKRKDKKGKNKKRKEEKHKKKINKGRKIGKYKRKKIWKQDGNKTYLIQEKQSANKIISLFSLKNKEKLNRL